MSGLAAAPCGSLVTTTVGSKTVACSATDQAGNSSNAEAHYSVVYGVGTCLGAPGRTILQPVNADGSSVFKQRSTVPAKFRVCDAHGVPVGTSGVVQDFRLAEAGNGTANESVNELVESTTPDLYFRWSPTDQQWIFNINTKQLIAGKTYGYLITLNDGSVIGFSYGLR